MKLAIVGSRNFTDYLLLCRKINEFINIAEVTHIVSGGAQGADALAERFAREYQKELLLFPADWKNLNVPEDQLLIRKNCYGLKYNAKAGFNRNRAIINAADMIIAFWDGHSPGTKHTIDTARALDKKIRVVIVS